jgi:uncharacterized damage-inducible protein DinB
MSDPRSDDRRRIVQWWDEAWDEGLWAGAWRRAVDELVPAQAAWRPVVPGRCHSIWQLVLHIVFWRESWLRRAATGTKPTSEEIERGNFPEIADRSEAAWSEARRRLHDTQQRIALALRDPAPENEPLVYFLVHDTHHFGQIALLRAMQGLPPTS